MSSKKRLMLIAALLVVSFAISCGVSFLLTPSPGPAPQQAAPTSEQPAQESALAQAPTITDLDRLKPRERQLEELIRAFRSKSAELQVHRRKLKAHEKRVRIAQELLKKEAQGLENLRFQLAGPLANLKEAKAELERTRILIEKDERVNVKRTAMIYEKMDPMACSKILAEMCTTGQHDAAKILFYMAERPAAKVLAEMDGSLAAKLSEQLKRIREKG